MSVNNLDWHFLPALIELLEFMMLALLGYLFVQLLHWHAAFCHRRAWWLSQLRRDVRKLRVLRKQLDQTRGRFPELPLPISMRRKWQALQWVGTVLRASRLARS